MNKPNKETMLDKKDKYITLFSLVVFAFSIAYVQLIYCSLNVEATSKQSLWNISFSKVETVDITEGARNVSDPNISGHSIFFDTSFMNEGDLITYKVRVQNKGNLNAILDSIYVYNPDYETFEYIFDGINEGDLLMAGDIKEFNFTIKVKGSVVDTKSNFFINLNYVQK